MIHFDIPAKLKTIEELEKLTLDENFWKNRSLSKQTIQKINNLKSIINLYQNLKEKISSLIDEIKNNDIGFDEELLELINIEFEDTFKEFSNFEMQMLLTDKFDNNNAIIEFHPGAGGTESQDWTLMLYDMYCKWAEKKGYKVEILDNQAGEEAGLKSASILVKGPFAYGYLKCEAGVHRLVRISPFDANKRRHTSFASIEVTPDYEDDVDISIKEEDIRIDTYRASGAGGQHINKTDSAVRITHLPTNIVVSCQSQRSQIQNKEMCMMMLKSKLYTIYLKEKEAEIAKLKGVQKANEWGSQIRSYVLHPYTLVKDHRTNYENGNASFVLNGNLDEFIFEYLKINIKSEVE